MLEESPSGQSPTELTNIFYGLIWDSQTWRAISTYLYPSKYSVAQLYPLALGPFSSSLTTGRLSPLGNVTDDFRGKR
jgi:hypothetical protein